MQNKLPAEKRARFWVVSVPLEPPSVASHSAMAGLALKASVPAILVRSGDLNYFHGSYFFPRLGAGSCWVLNGGRHRETSLMFDVCRPKVIHVSAAQKALSPQKCATYAGLIHKPE